MSATRWRKLRSNVWLIPVAHCAWPGCRIRCGLFTTRWGLGIEWGLNMLDEPGTWRSFKLVCGPWAIAVHL